MKGAVAAVSDSIRSTYNEVKKVVEDTTDFLCKFSGYFLAAIITVVALIACCIVTFLDSKLAFVGNRSKK